MMPRCPECRINIDHLDYERSCSEYGTYDLDTWFEPTETNTDTVCFGCPECGHPLFDNISGAEDFFGKLPEPKKSKKEIKENKKNGWE
jgi:hypothetical protein